MNTEERKAQKRKSDLNRRNTLKRQHKCVSCSQKLARHEKGNFSRCQACRDKFADRRYDKTHNRRLPKHAKPSLLT